MKYLTSRPLILVGSAVMSAAANATIRLMLIIWALASIGGAQAVHAQETASWGDVGISVSPLFREYLDVPVCCTPPGGWVTWGTGKYRLQVDYVRNRRQYRTSGGYSGIREGREVVVERGGVGINVAQVAVASLYWRMRETSRYSLHVLLGVGYWKSGERYCVAAGEPVNRLPSRVHATPTNCGSAST